MVFLNYRTSIARRFTILSRGQNGVSNEHSCLGPYFFRTKLFVGHGGRGGVTCGEAEKASE